MDRVHDLILERWSPVAFNSEPVEMDKVHLLFEAARWAPSSNNAQPWRFIYAARNTPDYEVFLELINTSNQAWAKTAPLFVLGLAQVISDYKDRPNRFAFYDTGMAVSNLLLQATHLGLMVHQMGGYDIERAKVTLEIPTRYEPLAMMAIGYKGDRGQLPEDIAQREDRERTRMGLSKFLMQGKYKEGMVIG